MPSNPSELDPSLNAAQLSQLAAERPDLWPEIISHPQAYPDLLAWIEAQRRSQPQAAPQPAQPRQIQHPFPPPTAPSAGVRSGYNTVGTPPNQPLAAKKSRKGALAALVVGLVLVLVSGGGLYFSNWEAPVTEAQSTLLSSGFNHVCKIDPAGKIYCWGLNSAGQLGNGEKAERWSDRSVSSQSPVEVGGISNAIEVTAGFRHTCALVAEGKVYCWGFGSDGQLGSELEATEDPVVYIAEAASVVPLEIANLANVKQISAGTEHTCALVEGGKVYCWGRNGSGQLGYGNAPSADSATPVEVAGLDGVTQISSNGYHSCAVIEEVKAYCWGRNYDGQLGNGELAEALGDVTVDSSVPVEVTGLENPIQVTTGEAHTCALVKEGKVYCWGRNGSGQLGNGQHGENLGDRSVNSAVPVEVSGLENVTQINAGAHHSCAVSEDKAYCWGANGTGQIGNRAKGEEIVDSIADQTNPVQITQLDKVTQLSAGGFFTCAVANEGKTYCWGRNAYGQLGIGTRPEDWSADIENSGVPVEVIGLN